MLSAATRTDGLRIGVVVLTRGDRPESLGLLLKSVATQEGPAIDIVVVANGVAVPDLPPGVRGVTTADNVGIPAGRNIGLGHLDTDIVLFLDDDGLLADDQTAIRVHEMFAANPALGIVSFRITDSDTGVTQRRHVPRLRVGDPHRSSMVTTFLGGACAIRMAVFHQVGILPKEFFYAHEETDFAWRAIGRGWSILYCADIVFLHPATGPAKHARYQHFNARNRVLLARRHLPMPIAGVYLGIWIAITIFRNRSRAQLSTWFAGFHAGWAMPLADRAPMTWHTIWLLTKHGRPPII